MERHLATPSLPSHFSQTHMNLFCEEKEQKRASQTSKNCCYTKSVVSPSDQALSLFCFTHAPEIDLLSQRNHSQLEPETALG